MKRITRRLVALLLLISFEVAVLWIIGVVSFILFFYLTHKVFVDREYALDMAVLSFVEQQRTPSLTKFMKFISFFASHEYLMVAPPLVVCAMLFSRKMHWYALLVLVNSVSITLLNQGLKHLFSRPRPITALLEQSGKSFPSGHAMIGIVFYGLFIYIIYHLVGNRFWRWFWCLFILGFILLIGYSRIYLHVHYFTDVVAGFAIGSLWLILSIHFLNKLEPLTSKQFRSRFYKEN